MQNADATTKSTRVTPHGSAPSAPGYAAGTVIVGKYRLESCLGEGGMATVWLARNVLLDAPVALKLMTPAIQSDDTIERFFVEARVQAQLKHPNIVRVFDFGHTELGDPFIVMEVLEGITFRDFMTARGRVNATAAVQLLLPVIEALCHAHEHGVVHRDLKPENIFLDRSDVEVAPKLLDFGIAKLTGSSFPKRHVTQSGALLGSPPYMAPEQAQGLGNVDHRADIWALCVVLYEAVSGAPAFPGEGYAVLRGVVEDALPPLLDTGAGEDALSRVLALGLKKDPAFRYQSMRALGTALAQWLCDHGEAEDLHGNRISRSWNVKEVRSHHAPVEYIREASAARVTERRRAQMMPRLLMAAAILLAGIVLPVKLKLEAASDKPFVATPAPLAAAQPTINAEILAQISGRTEPTLSLTHSIAMPRAVLPRREISEQRHGLKPIGASMAPSEADLGLKEAY